MQGFRDYFTINVTEFFRDAEPFHLLEQRALPALRGAHRILATDVDRTILARARTGAGYLKSDVRNGSKERLARWFQAASDGQSWAVRPEEKALVEFREHNLLDLAPGGRFDLILCRNVVIYFTDEAKRGLYERLVASPRPGGILFVGGTEIVPGTAELGLTTAGPSFC